jgi:hypothetical protein
MNRYVFRLLDTYKKFSVKKTEKKYLAFFKANKEVVVYKSLDNLYPDEDFIGKLIYKNENWEYVVKRFHNRFLEFFNINTNTIDNDCADNKTTRENNHLYFKSAGLKDDWIYYYQQDYKVTDYELAFDATFNTHFREIQLAFRYRDFYNRYRFRIEAGLLHFDIVNKGQFYNSLYTAPFVISLNKKYHFKIVVKGNKYSFLHNDNVIMTITDEVNIYLSGGVAIILWDDSGNSNIDCSYENISLSAVG